MKITEISLYGIGPYSGMSVSENLLVTKKFYDRYLKDKVENQLSTDGILLPELDGRDSKVYGDVDFYHYKDDEELMEKYCPENDDSFLRNVLFKIDGVKENSKVATDYFNKLGNPIELNITINSKYKERVSEIIKELEEKYK